MVTCKGWAKKDSLKECWNGAHLEDEEKEDIEIRMQEITTGMREGGELATWNWSPEKGGERK